MRAPRDLTLGGIRKKTFSPSIPVRREKSIEEYGLIEHVFLKICIRLSLFVLNFYCHSRVRKSIQSLTIEVICEIVNFLQRIFMHQ